MLWLTVVFALGFLFFLVLDFAELSIITPRRNFVLVFDVNVTDGNRVFVDGSEIYALVRLLFPRIYILLLCKAQFAFLSVRFVGGLLRLRIGSSSDCDFTILLFIRCDGCGLSLRVESLLGFRSLSGQNFSFDWHNGIDCVESVIDFCVSNGICPARFFHLVNGFVDIVGVFIFEFEIFVFVELDCFLTFCFLFKTFLFLNFRLLKAERIHAEICGIV